jgi:hypothetical protein
MVAMPEEDIKKTIAAIEEIRKNFRERSESQTVYTPEERKIMDERMDRHRRLTKTNSYTVAHGER